MPAQYRRRIPRHDARPRGWGAEDRRRRSCAARAASALRRSPCLWASRQAQLLRIPRGLLRQENARALTAAQALNRKIRGSLGADDDLVGVRRALYRDKAAPSRPHWQELQMRSAHREEMEASRMRAL